VYSAQVIEMFELFTKKLGLKPRHKRTAFLVESRRDIIPCPSLLNLGVRLSPHPASDILSFRFCSYGYNRGSFHELLEGFLVSNCYDWHQHDVNVPSHH